MPERVLEVDEEEVEEVDVDVEGGATEVVVAGLASRDLLLEPWLLVRSLDRLRPSEASVELRFLFRSSFRP